jgi:peptidoglycan/xylan/chitin deacetylase (PgdA/CDA1 family)
MASQEHLSERPALDGISCVGILLIGFLVLSTLSVAIARPAEDGADTAATPAAVTVTGPLFSALTPTRLARITATARATATATASASPTIVASPTATNTATLLPTATASLTVPPPATSTMAPAITAEPIVMATATRPLLPTPNGIYSQTLRVPILMYHYISTPPEDADIYRVDLSVEAAMFRAQMEYLVSNGYTAIDFYDLSLAITNKKPLPPRPVIITLDDGYRDAYDNAFPILRELGLTATVFIITELVDRNHPAYMNWDMIREMSAAGIRMEPHTKTHMDLRERSRDFLIYQILGSQQTLAAHIGYTPRYLAYPGGRYDDAVLEVMQDLGFWGAVTTMGGRWHGFEDRYEWTRMRVRYTTTLTEFADLVK